MGMTISNLCDSCTNIGCEFQSGIVITECTFYMQSTVDAITKDQYEARLKNDMVAILTELHLKMEELGDDLDPTEDWDYGYKSGVEDMIQLLDERIDKLKGESDAQEQKKE